MRRMFYQVIQSLADLLASGVILINCFRDGKTNLSGHSVLLTVDRR